MNMTWDILEALLADILNFRDLPDWIRENKQEFEGKKILTYCTGGIRCEKFSGWLLNEGFEDVSQLEVWNCDLRKRP